MTHKKTHQHQQDFIVMGLDPGFHHFGWAVVAYKRENFGYEWPLLLDVGTLEQKTSRNLLFNKENRSQDHRSKKTSEDHKLPRDQREDSKEDSCRTSSPWSFYPKKNQDNRTLNHLCYLYNAFQDLLETHRVEGVVMERIIIPPFKNPMSSVVLGYSRSMALLAIGQSPHVHYFWDIAPTELKSCFSGYGLSSKEDLRSMLTHHYSRDFSLDESDALAMACCAPFLYQEDILSTITNP